MTPLRVMLDLETMGTGPTSAIVAIGAARFSAQGVGETFYQVVDLESSVKCGLTMEASTVMWWLKQGDAARRALTENPDDLSTSLVRFSCWLDTLHVGYDTSSADVEIWGNGAAFDIVILANAYKTLDMPVPWNFWNDQCYRTLKRQFPHLAVPMDVTRTAHKAIDDAIHQAICASRMLVELEAMQDAYRAVQQGASSPPLP